MRTAAFCFSALKLDAGASVECMFQVPEDTDKTGMVWFYAYPWDGASGTVRLTADGVPSGEVDLSNGHIRWRASVAVLGLIPGQRKTIVLEADGPVTLESFAIEVPGAAR